MKNIQQLPKLAFLIAFSFCLSFGAESTFGENKYVAVTGDDSNPGTKSLPWRTLRAACVRLEPGDRLLVGPGDYIEFKDDGEDTFEDVIFVRTIGTEEEGFQYKPFIGDPNKTTIIKAWNSRCTPRVFGNFDIRGSYIQISGLEIIGDPARTIAPGIGVYSSHDILCKNNVIHDHGGSGISFNQSDMIAAVGNMCFGNATTNPDQGSGISCYQPIRRSPSKRKIGVRMDWNICFNNRNEVPGRFGITDGNGIILDDHYYTQTNDLILGAIDESPDPNGAGTPQISTSSELLEGEGEPELIQVPLPYDRTSLVRNNFCFRNGGRGVQIYLVDDAKVTGNYLINNVKSQGLFENLPTDESEVPLFLNGELSSTDSTRVSISRNWLFATSPLSVAGNEFYFLLDPLSPRGNSWRKNRYFNLGHGDLYSLAGLSDSDANLAKDANFKGYWFWWR